jgi:hypothetical protein
MLADVRGFQFPYSLQDRSARSIDAPHVEVALGNGPRVFVTSEIIAQACEPNVRCFGPRKRRHQFVLQGRDVMHFSRTQLASQSPALPSKAQIQCAEERNPPKIKFCLPRLRTDGSPERSCCESLVAREDLGS